MGSYFTPHAPKEAGAVILVVLAHLFFSISLRSRENFLSLLRCCSVFFFRRISSCVVNPRHGYLLSISGSTQPPRGRLGFWKTFLFTSSLYLTSQGRHIVQKVDVFLHSFWVYSQQFHSQMAAG